jgi:hypothetical protein
MINPLNTSIMATIKLIGELDFDLTKIGLRAGDIIRNATYSKSNGAMNFDYHYVINNECVVYPENYEIIKLSENEKENIPFCEIKQHGKTILYSDTGHLKMIFHNLTGQNFSGTEYQIYIDTVAIPAGFERGAIEFVENGILKDKRIIQ